MDTIDKLDDLFQLRSEVVKLSLQQDEAGLAAMPEEVAAKLASIEEEYSARKKTITELIATLEKEIKSDVLYFGATISGIHLKAVWNKGRVSWDTKALNGYMVAHPELASLRKQGKPSVTIRG